MSIGINELIDQLYASISDAKGFPLSVDKCILDRDHALDLLDEIRAQLPAEVAEAKRLVSAKAEVIRKSCRPLQKPLALLLSNKQQNKKEEGGGEEGL